MANSTKTSVYCFLLATAALLGTQACAHQLEEITDPPTADDDSGSGGSTARAGSGGGGSTSTIVPPTTSGKGGSTSTSGKGGSTGSSGSTSTGGTGGSSDSGGSGGEEPTGGEPAPDTGFSVQYMASQTMDASVAISSQFVIKNDSAETVPLGEFTLRYYFTDELTIAPELQMFWAHLTGGASFNFTLTQVDMTATAPHADSYFEFALAADAPLLEPGKQAELAWQSHNGMSQLNVQSNDYSFDATKTQYTEWDHVVLLRNGEPYWGTPP